MRKIEDEDRGAFDGVLDRRVGDEVLRESNVRKVFDVFVVGVDDVGQLLGRITLGGIVMGRGFGNGDLFFVHPHLDLLFEDVGMLFRILCDDFGYG